MFEKKKRFKLKKNSKYSIQNCYLSFYELRYQAINFTIEEKVRKIKRKYILGNLVKFQVQLRNLAMNLITCKS